MTISWSWPETRPILDRTAELQVNPVLAYVAPAIGVLWIAIAVRVFNRELRNYQSAGS